MLYGSERGDFGARGRERRKQERETVLSLDLNYVLCIVYSVDMNIYMSFFLLIL